MTRVAVFGALGRMGSTSVAALNRAEGLEVVAQIDVDDSAQSAVDAQAEVALIFSTPDAAIEQVKFCIDVGIHAVVGTSGFDKSRQAEVSEWLKSRPELGVLIVPNFSIGAVLLMNFAAKAAPYFESAEILEMHHPDKIDAPSGTAVRTAEIMSASRAAAESAPIPDATTTDPLGARGAKVSGIPVHAIRARGYVASQEVLLGNSGEIMSLRHDSTDRESFMPGVVASVRAVGEMPGLTVGLDSVLGLR